MQARVITLLFSIRFALPSLAQSKAFVQGQVVDETEQPIIDTTDGAVTGRDGRFAFSTRHLGPRDPSASFIGFEPTPWLRAIPPRCAWCCGAFSLNSVKLLSIPPSGEQRH